MTHLSFNAILMSAVDNLCLSIPGLPFGRLLPCSAHVPLGEANSEAACPVGMSPVCLRTDPSASSPA